VNKQQLSKKKERMFNPRPARARHNEGDAKMEKNPLSNKNLKKRLKPSNKNNHRYKWGGFHLGKREGARPPSEERVGKRLQGGNLASPPPRTTCVPRVSVPSRTLERGGGENEGQKVILRPVARGGTGRCHCRGGPPRNAGTWVFCPKNCRSPTEGEWTRWKTAMNFAVVREELYPRKPANVRPESH